MARRINPTILLALGVAGLTSGPSGSHAGEQAYLNCKSMGYEEAYCTTYRNKPDMTTTAGTAPRVSTSVNQGSASSTTFDAAAQSWVGRDARDMVKVWGRPTSFKKGSDEFLDPTIITWSDSVYAQAPSPPPAPASSPPMPRATPTYNTTCQSYGNGYSTTNCTTRAQTNENQQAAYMAGQQLGQALAQRSAQREYERAADAARLASYVCSVTAVIEPESYRVLNVETRGEPRETCNSKYSSKRAPL